MTVPAPLRINEAAAALNATHARMRTWRDAHPNGDDTPAPRTASALAAQAATMGAMYAVPDADARTAAPADRRADAWAVIAPRRFRSADLDGMHDTPARPDVIAWAGTEGRPPNLVMSGPTGVGKTWAATAALRARHDAGDRVAWWSVPELLDALRPGGNPDAYRLAVAADVLLLDELGAHKASDWADERLYCLVNRRYLDELPTIVTSNLTAADKLREVIGSRMWSRLVGDDAVVLGYGGRDLRTGA